MGGRSRPPQGSPAPSATGAGDSRGASAERERSSSHGRSSSTAVGMGVAGGSSGNLESFKSQLGLSPSTSAPKASELGPLRVTPQVWVVPCKTQTESLPLAPGPWPLAPGLTRASAVGASARASQN